MKFENFVNNNLSENDKSITINDTFDNELNRKESLETNDTDLFSEDDNEIDEYKRTKYITEINNNLVLNKLNLNGEDKIDTEIENSDTTISTNEMQFSDQSDNRELSQNRLETDNIQQETTVSETELDQQANSTYITFSLAHGISAQTEQNHDHNLLAEKVLDELDQNKAQDLQCIECKSHLSSRGQLVYLVSDLNIALYSTDNVSRAMKEIDDQYKISSCDCIVQNTNCATCLGPIGYHVVEECKICQDFSNQQQWVFSQDRLVAKKRQEDGQPVSWDELPAIELNQKRNLICFEDSYNKALECPICYQVMEEAMVMRCGHSACKLCAYRTVDLYKQCPSDRISCYHNDLRPNYVLRDLINSLEISCNMCNQKMNYGQYDSHVIRNHSSIVNLY